MSPIANELTKTELFRDASEEILDIVLQQAQPRTLVAGEILLSPKQDNHHIYLLLEGTLGVHFDSVDSPEIRELAQGASVGEMSVIDSTPPSAFVLAKTDCKVFPIHRELLHSLVADTNPVAANLLRLLTKWLKSNTQRIVNDRQQISELSNHANIDALTGLYNRRWLDNALPRLIEQACKGDQPLCLLILDVDHFKKYNDSQGHLGGDQALIAMGEVLKTTVRPYDFATRYGGEEFLVVLPNTAKDEGIAAAERIRQTVEKKLITTPEGKPLPGITASIGLAMNNAHTTLPELISEADAQLYQAKASGRNRVNYQD